MEFKILLLDDFVNSAITLVEEALIFGGMNFKSSQQSSDIIGLESLCMQFDDIEQNSTSITLCYNSTNIKLPMLVDDLICTIKERQMLFDLILIDDNWGGGSGYQHGQKILLPSLFSTTQSCHYCLFTQHTDQNERIQKFSQLLQSDEYQDNSRIHLIGKDEKHNLYSLIYRLIGEKRKRILVETDISSTFCNILGKSHSMLHMFDLIAQVAVSDSTILIRGENGTGKALVAKAIHNKSARKDKSFATINCATIVDSLAESELFGHIKGAFTGANNKSGWFESVSDGTIFFDEVGYMSFFVQAKLLQVLESRTFNKVGDTKELKTNARIITATNCNLEEMIQNKKFRDDLYYRLNTIEINVPPLRERCSDIPILAHHFITTFANRQPAPILSPEALQALTLYHWPGNVRELKNCIEYVTVFLKNTNIINPSDLPSNILTHIGSSTSKVNMSKSDNIDLKYYHDEEVRIKARQYLDKFEHICNEIISCSQSVQKITRDMIGEQLRKNTGKGSGPAISQICKKYGTVMKALLEDDLHNKIIRYPLLLNKTKILTWRYLKMTFPP